jgi:Ca2+-binding RTX toxin-like protein
MSILIAYDATGQGINMSNVTTGGGFLFNDSSISTTFLAVVDEDTLAFSVSGAGLVQYMLISGVVNIDTGDAVLTELIYGDADFNPLFAWLDMGLSVNLYDDFSAGISYSILNAADFIYGNNYSDIIKAGAGNDEVYGYGGADTLYGEAGIDTLNGGAGNDILIGGLGNDILIGGLDNDTYVVDSITDTITELSGGGTDTVKSSVTFTTLAANVENLTLTGSGNISGTGNAGNNTITGNSGNNTLNGGSGNDTLIGGLGNDALTGGIGSDTFVLNTAPNTTSNKDTITDFNVVADTIQLENSIFTSLVTTGTLDASMFRKGAGVNNARDANDHIIYNTTSGALYYDADGVGGSAAVQIALIGTSTHANLTVADFVVI